mgnify:CR=1 FL=1
MHRVEPVEHLLHRPAAIAALAVVEPDEDKSQRGGVLKGEQHRAHDALALAVGAGQVQCADDEHADAVVIRIGQKAQQHAPAGT